MYFIITYELKNATKMFIVGTDNSERSDHFEERENLSVAAVLDVLENGRYDLWRRVRNATHSP